MNKSDRELLKRFLEHPRFIKEKEAFDQLLGFASWGAVVGARLESAEFWEWNDLAHRFLKVSGPRRGALCREIARPLKNARRTKNPASFSCRDGTAGVLLPLLRAGDVIGCLVLFRLGAAPGGQALSVFAAFTATLLEEAEKEKELAELSATVRPRAIALSTIHTVHRLISTILDLDDLLPRVARLALQVLRAQRAAVLLLDDKKRFLITKAVVDLRRKQIPLRPARLRVGSGIEGRVAKTGTGVVSPTLLSVPLLHEDILGVITVRDKTDGSEFTAFDREILSTLAEQAVIAIKNAQLYQDQEKLAIGSIRSLAAVLDTQSPYTYTHAPAFAHLIQALGRALGLSQEDLRYLHYAALMPDVGRASIPEEILRKPSELTAKELQFVREHPIKGAQIMQHIDVLKPCIPIIKHHHERYDGKGYPSGLKREAIPLGARIMSLAEAFEAMVYKKRAYRRRLSFAEAVAEIKRSSGTQFDPKVVRAFLKLFESGEVAEFFREGVLR